MLDTAQELIRTAPAPKAEPTKAAPPQNLTDEMMREELMGCLGVALFGLVLGFVMVIVSIVCLLNAGRQEELEDQQRDEQAKQEGDRIVAALRSYYSEAGIYPAALEELVPRYFSALPEAGDSRSWNYHLTTKEGQPRFLLSCTSRSGGWDVNDNSADLCYDSNKGTWIVTFDIYEE